MLRSRRHHATRAGLGLPALALPALALASACGGGQGDAPGASGRTITASVAAETAGSSAPQGEAPALRGKPPAPLGISTLARAERLFGEVDTPAVRVLLEGGGGHACSFSNDLAAARCWKLPKNTVGDRAPWLVPALAPSALLVEIATGSGDQGPFALQRIDGASPEVVRELATATPAQAGVLADGSVVVLERPREGSSGRSWLRRQRDGDWQGALLIDSPAVYHWLVLDWLLTVTAPTIRGPSHVVARHAGPAPTALEPEIVVADVPEWVAPARGCSTSDALAVRLDGKLAFLSSGHATTVDCDATKNATFSCSTGAVVLDWAAGDDATFVVEERRCTAEGCVAASSGKLALAHAAWSQPTVAHVGGRTLLVWSSGAKDGAATGVYMRLAPLAELATAPDVLLVADAARGGLDILRTAIAARGDQALVLLGAPLPPAPASAYTLSPASQIYAARVSADGAAAWVQATTPTSPTP